MGETPKQRSPVWIVGLRCFFEILWIIQADNVVIYDNSQKFVSVYRREQNQVIKNKWSEYPWINPKITFEAAIQKQLNGFVKDNPDLRIEKPINNPENKNDRPNY